MATCCYLSEPLGCCQPLDGMSCIRRSCSAFLTRFIQVSTSFHCCITKSLSLWLHIVRHALARENMPSWSIPLNEMDVTALRECASRLKRRIVTPLHRLVYDSQSQVRITRMTFDEPPFSAMNNASAYIRLLPGGRWLIGIDERQTISCWDLAATCSRSNDQAPCLAAQWSLTSSIPDAAQDPGIGQASIQDITSSVEQDCFAIAVVYPLKTAGSGVTILCLTLDPDKGMVPCFHVGASFSVRHFFKLHCALSGDWALVGPLFDHASEVGVWNWRTNQWRGLVPSSPHLGSPSIHEWALLPNNSVLGFKVVASQRGLLDLILTRLDDPLGHHSEPTLGDASRLKNGPSVKLSLPVRIEMIRGKHGAKLAGSIKLVDEEYVIPLFIDAAQLFVVFVGVSTSSDLRIRLLQVQRVSPPPRASSSLPSTERSLAMEYRAAFCQFWLSKRFIDIKLRTDPSAYADIWVKGPLGTQRKLCSIEAERAITTSASDVLAFDSQMQIVDVCTFSGTVLCASTGSEFYLQFIRLE
ncbi:hypothetical protein DL93DRAFT_422417 [Clavulina sp. PMI_390]|nr:hypothetical protein DL93DRAFT_422417 [Clavulina sp. PMI_390]